MSQIYQNAFLTLFATMSSSGEGGPFTSTPSTSGAKTVPEGSRSMPVHFRPMGDHALPWHGHGQDLEIPLITRAWVYQERLLLPRAIYTSGSFACVGKCLEAEKCQCKDQNYAFDSRSRKQDIALNFQNRSLTWLAGTWERIVTEYSSLELSKPTDKLPAVSGVAKQFAKPKSLGRYLAGLWENTLHLDMLWFTGSPARKSTPWRAPTWS